MLVTIKDMETRFRIAHQTIGDWVKEAGLKEVRRSATGGPQRSRLFREEDLLALIELHNPTPKVTQREALLNALQQIKNILAKL